VAEKVARTEAEGKAAKAEANLQAKATIVEQEETKLKELAEDIRNCTITAPHDGMVVYFVPESSKVGGQQKSLLAVGEPAYENQKLMQIPDLRQMQVRVKIHESVQPRLRADATRKTAAGDCLTAALAAAPPGPGWLGTLLAAPETRRLAAEEGLLQEEAVVRPGQSAQVKVASLDRVFSGRVRRISTVASQLDSMSSDVRVYPTSVLIDGTDQDLRPGRSAEVTVFVEERDGVLRLPVHAVLDVGGEKFCYVKAGGEIVRRVLDVGLNNSRFVEVRQGLEEGELVVQNPRPLAERLGDLSARAREPGEGAGAVQR
jgi:HlyD family secretion protein